MGDFLQDHQSHAARLKETRTPEVLTVNGQADFPAAALQAYGVQAVHPDTFLASFINEPQELFLRGLKNHRTSLKNPPKDAQEYIQDTHSDAARKRLERACRPR